MPVLSSYAFTASVLFVIAGWMCVAVLNCEDATQAQITLVHRRRPVVIYLMKLLIAFVAAGALGVCATIIPVMLGLYGQPVGVAQILAGLAAHLSIAMLGTAVGCHFNESLVKNLSASWGGMAITWAMAFSGRGFISFILPPVLPLANVLLRWDAGGVAVDAKSIGVALWTVVYTTLLAVWYTRRMARRC